ncbi:MAG: hypothetical protein VCD00_14610 [Candidatus Hydrogenedentota bacterium]
MTVLSQKSDQTELSGFRLGMSVGELLDHLHLLGSLDGIKFQPTEGFSGITLTLPKGKYKGCEFLILGGRLFRIHFSSTVTNFALDASNIDAGTLARSIVSNVDADRLKYDGTEYVYSYEYPSGYSLKVYDDKQIVLEINMKLWESVDMFSKELREENLSAADVGSVSDPNESQGAIEIPTALKIKGFYLGMSLKDAKENMNGNIDMEWGEIDGTIMFANSFEQGFLQFSDDGLVQWMAPPSATDAIFGSANMTAE